MKDLLSSFTLIKKVSISIEIELIFNDLENNNNISFDYFNNKILKPSIHLSMLLKSNIKNIIKISKLNNGVNLNEYFSTLLSNNGNMLLSNNEKKINIKNIFIINNIENIFLLIDTEYDFLDMNNIKIFIEKINSLLETINLINISKKYCLNLIINDDKQSNVEIVNHYCLKDIEKSILYELMRQEDLLRKNNKLKEEKRFFRKNSTIPLEESNYIRSIDKNNSLYIENNYMLYDITTLKEKFSKNVPEDPDNKILKYMSDYNLSNEFSKLIVKNNNLMEIFNSLKDHINTKFISKWILIFISELKYRSMKIDEEKINYFKDFLLFCYKNNINQKIALTTLRDKLDGKIKDNFNLSSLIYINNDITEKDIIKDIKTNIYESKDMIIDYKNGNIKILDFMTGKLLKKYSKNINAKKLRDMILTELNNIKDDFIKNN